MRGTIVTMKMVIGFTLGILVLTAAAQQAAPPKDGEIPLPADYKSWPKFLTAVQRPDIKQVRDLYVNSTGERTARGEEFLNGTVFVMENYKARENPDGTLAKGSDGNLVKGELAKIFVMAKGKGWGQDVSDNAKTGWWVYSAYGPDGKPSAEDFIKCRSCHFPLGQKDFVQRYDEYFDKRSVHMH
ncbi:MAG TPA: cytochrome P460 family protein [Nitrospiria bacterium]|nr:cytochrome P460 family protein [Nitrospiria bacterium]